MLNRQRVAHQRFNSEVMPVDHSTAQLAHHQRQHLVSQPPEEGLHIGRATVNCETHG